MIELFYKPISVFGDNNNILFWGCLHLMHNPIHWATPLWAQRGYGSAEDHFAGLVRNWNNKANNETVGFLLGDSVFGENAVRHLEYFFHSIKFRRIYMCAGNHYAGIARLFGDSNIWNITDSKQVIIVPNYFEVEVNKRIRICASHYPVLSWNGAAKGSWMLYAHVHGNLNKSAIGKLYQSQGRSREVSVEAASSPLSVEELKFELDRKLAYAPDHHTKDTQNPF